MKKPEAKKKYSKKAETKIQKVMKEYSEGKLRSGSKKGPRVSSRKQALAIGISEARRKGFKAGEVWKKSARKK
jgi:hypothetical protein